MKRFYILFIGLVLMNAVFMGFVDAQTVSRDEALNVAKRLFGSNASSQSAYENQVATAATNTGANSMYMAQAVSQVSASSQSVEEFSITQTASLYRVKVSGKSVIMTSDKRMPAIIAIMDNTSAIDWSDIPPAFKDFLSSYEIMTAEVRQNVSPLYANEQWATTYNPVDNESIIFKIVEPLLQKNGRRLAWDQDKCYNCVVDTNCTDCYKSYNLYCPQRNGYHGRRALVGCVAVSLAQVLWYWEWPSSATITKVNNGAGYLNPPYGYNVSPTVAGNNITFEYDYDWSKMPWAIEATTPQDEVNEIASLLRSCGLAVNMDYYYPGGSGVSMSMSRDALKNIFGYSKNTRMIYGSSENVEQQLIDELQAGRPIIASGGAHAFNLDGYGVVNIGGKDVNYFHANWGGWSGSRDCWVYLSNMRTMDGFGIYDEGLSFIIGIEPEFTNLCYSETYMWYEPTNNFKAYNGGSLDIKNLQVASGRNGTISSGTSVRILPSSRIASGSTVRVFIGQRRCTPKSNRQLAPRRNTSETEESPLDLAATPDVIEYKDNRLTIHLDENFTARLYSVAGQYLLTSDRATIDVSGLPSGVYLVVVQTSSGAVWQQKFVKM